jgi:fumarylacetoacetate (FAA) hydrolase family protein
MDHDMRLPGEGVFLGRARVPGSAHPLVVTVRDGSLVDITARDAPTVRDICEMPDPAAHVVGAEGRDIGDLKQIAANSFEAARDDTLPFLLSPVDLQAVKGSGVTFVVSLLERVIEEQARGDPEKAEAIRRDIASQIGDDLSRLRPGSPEAMEIKRKLVARGAW